jgi:hypothetical protein
MGVFGGITGGEFFIQRLDIFMNYGGSHFIHLDDAFEWKYFGEQALQGKGSTNRITLILARVNNYDKSRIKDYGH